MLLRILVQLRVAARSERGFSTAELLASAALAIGALIAIWLAMQSVGVDIVNWMGDQIMGP